MKRGTTSSNRSQTKRKPGYEPLPVFEFTPNESCKYIVLNKPFRVLSQFSIEEDSDKKTLASFGLPPNVYPVGRLDFDSEGLLLLSDDKTINNALLEPSHGHCRTYLAQVENLPSQKKLQELSFGVMIENQWTLPAQISLLSEPPQIEERNPPIRERKLIPTCWLSLTLTEGRNRQVRKMTAAIGCPTLRLVRIAIGGVSLSELDLKPGEWCTLSFEQVKRLFQH